MSSAAEHLLAAIVGAEPEPALIEVRPERGRSEFFAVASVARAADCAIRRSRQRETWVGMAPRRLLLKDGRQFGGSEAILHAWVVSADCDSDEALDALTIFSPQPSFVLTSGGTTESGRDKLHAHWPLSHSIRRADVTPAKKRLVEALGSDAKITDAPRCMRLPGMVTHKYGSPRECTSTEDHPERRYTLAQVLANTPELEIGDRPKRDRRETPERARDDSLRQRQETISPPQYVYDLTGVEVGADGKCCCPLPDHHDTRPSFMAYPTPEQGWFCFGCRRGGDLYTLAGLLLGIPQRQLFGRDFERVWRHVRTFYGLAVEA